MKLSLFYPVRPYYVNQHFGDNIPCVKNFGMLSQKIVSGGVTTCPPGYEKLYPKFGMRGHNGMDLKSGVQNVYAAVDGVVIEKQVVPARGLGIGILSNDQFDFGGFGTHYIKLRYWHLHSFKVEIGDHVKVGTLLGKTDNTGYSSGNHLHFEAQLMDKDAGGHPFLTNPPAAIKGAIDIEPYFTGIYADEFAIKLSQLETLLLALKAFYEVYYPPTPGMSSSFTGRSNN